MPKPTPLARLLQSAAALRDRLGVAPTPAHPLPEPPTYGDADRGALLAAGRWTGCGRSIDLPRGGIWEAEPGDPRLERARGAFVWLDDLAGYGARAARGCAQDWTLAWARGAGASSPWDPEIAGERAVRLVGHARFVTEGLDAGSSAAFWRAAAGEGRRLGRAWTKAPPGLPQLRALVGRVWTQRALAAPDLAADVTRLGQLAAELVGPEGELGSRRPDDLAEALALLVWTARLLEDAGGADPAHLAAIGRAAQPARRLRLGDGRLPRFHGGGAGDAARLDRALAEVRLPARAPAETRKPMGYARLAGGRVALVLDGAGPPEGVFAAGAHAGALAFEMSVGRHPLVVNAGPGALFGPEFGQRARETAAHSTVEVAGASSADVRGGALAGGPTLVSLRQAQDATGMWLLGTHDGYVAGHGLLHERRVFVDARGLEVRGEEILNVTDARARAAFDRAAEATGGRMTVAARFHLHPDVAAEYDPGPDAVYLTLPDGEIWAFRAAAGETRLEESLHFDADAATPRPSKQVVVRVGVVEYLGQIIWSFGRLAEAPRAG